MDDKPLLKNLERKIEQLQKQTADLQRSVDLHAKNALQLDLIRKAQSLFLAEEDESRIYDILLRTLIEITESEFGFLDEVCNGDDGGMYKKNLAISNLAWDESSRELYEQLIARGGIFSFLDNLAGMPALTGEVVISNDPQSDPRSAGIPDGHPPLKAYMGLPLFFGNELIGVAGVANRKGGYETQIAEFIKPLLSSCAGITFHLRQRKLARSAEKALQLLDRAIEASNQGISITDPKQPDNPLIHVNRGFTDITGYRKSELLGRSMRLLHGPDTDPATVSAIGKTLKAGREITAEILNYRKDGTPFWNRLSISPVTDESGALTNFVAIHTDVTDRRQAETDLRRWEHLFRHAHWGIAISEDRKTIHAMNPAFARMHGFRMEELKNTPIAELFVPEARQELKYHIEAAYNKGHHCFESRRLRKDGSTFPCQIDLSAVKDVGGKPLYHVAHVTDITERKRAEEELNTLRLAVEQSVNGINITDLEGVIISANPASESIYGYEPGELTGRHVRDLNADPDISESQIIPAIKTKGHWSGELVQKKKDGSRFHAHLSASMVTRNSEPIGMLAIVGDISDRKLAEKELRRQAERLAILRETDRAVLEYRSIGETAAAVLAKLYSVIKFDRASVMVFDYDASQARFIATNIGGKPVYGTREPWSFDFIFSGSAPAGTEPRMVNDIEGRPVKTELERTLRKLKLKAYLSVPIKTQNAVIGALNFATRAANAFRREDLEIANEVADSLANAIRNAQLVGSLESKRGQLQALAARLIDVEERERKWLARELHDQVGQNLTALNLNLTVLQGALAPEAGEINFERVEDSFRLLEETTSQIRNLTSELRPSILDDYGLTAAVRWYAEHFSERTGIRVDLQIKKPERRLDAALETAIFRISQEALTNVAKHSGADRAEVVLEEKNGVLHLRVIDNGEGFSSDRLRSSRSDGGWGLMTMRERITALGGDFKVTSTPGGGTAIAVEVKS